MRGIDRRAHWPPVLHAGHGSGASVARHHTRPPAPLPQCHLDSLDPFNGVAQIPLHGVRAAIEELECAVPP